MEVGRGLTDPVGSQLSGHVILCAASRYLPDSTPNTLSTRLGGVHIENP